MIVATVQGNEEGGKHITVKNGKRITGKEQQEVINELYDKVRGIEINGDIGIEELKGKEIFCYMEHPEVDSYGRKGIAFIVWDKKEKKEIIKRTIEEIGLDYDKFKIKYDKFNNFINKLINKLNNNSKQKQIILVGLAAGVVAAIIITLAINK